MNSDRLIARAIDVLRRCDFPGYQWRVSADGGNSVFMRATYMEPDVYSGVEQRQWTRKWLLSENMTDSEIVQTAFKLCLTSMEHRAREHFKYRGARIFGPHFDVDDLHRLCTDGRENAGGRHPNPPQSGVFT